MSESEKHSETEFRSSPEQIAAEQEMGGADKGERIPQPPVKEPAGKLKADLETYRISRFERGLTSTIIESEWLGRRKTQPGTPTPHSSRD
jgi:hypothetical protein